MMTIPPGETQPHAPPVRQRELQTWLAAAPSPARQDPRVQRLLAEIAHYEGCLVRAQHDHAANRPVPSLAAWLHRRAGGVVLGMALAGAVAALHPALLLAALGLAALGGAVLLGRACWGYALRSRERRARIQQYQAVLARYHADLMQLVNTVQGE